MPTLPRGAARACGAILPTLQLLEAASVDPMTDRAPCMWIRRPGGRDEMTVGMEVVVLGARVTVTRVNGDGRDEMVAGRAVVVLEARVTVAQANDDSNATAMAMAVAGLAVTRPREAT